MKCLSKARSQPGSGPVTRILVLAILMAFVPLIPQESSGGEEDPMILVYPEDVSIPRGSTATTEVRLENVSDLLKVEFELRFDPQVVQVVNSDEPHQLARQIGVGDHLAGWSRHRNDVFNEHGVIDFDYYLGEKSTPVSGTVQVAVITWRGDRLGVSDLLFEAASLSSAGTRIVLRPKDGDVDRATDGRIEVIPPTIAPTPAKTTRPTDTSIPTRTLSPTHTLAPPSTGRVKLQGRDAYTDTKMYLTGEPCPEAPTGPPASHTKPGAITDGEGYFELSPAPGEADQCLLAFQPGYLMGRRASPGGEAGTITLPAGDVTQDNQVDWSDLGLIAGCFLRPVDVAADLSDECYYNPEDRQVLIVDLNQDGYVDIYDLAMVSRNFGKKGPVDGWVVFVQ